MRLLSFDSHENLSLTDFRPNKTPAYAILSHTWGEEAEEVTFKDLVANKDSAHVKIGYEKILFCGRQSAKDGLKYFWVDSCCIDKSSSAELSQAVNSMFHWYQNSSRCYVYLSDVSTSCWELAFRKSRWFTRGWTLQELLAPSTVKFFSVEGDFLGDKESLEKQVHEITGIAISALQGRALEHFSIEQRFSWASNRETTYVEDQAYSLVGIFGVVIPVIYGEGLVSAFDRLKEQISKHSNSEETGAVERSMRNREYYKSILKALKFDHIDDRFNNIKPAIVDTCRWILTNPKYLAWLDQSNLSDHHGFLWVKGKPGAGKSTLMKFVLTEGINSRTRLDDEAFHISFFFNARGSHLEKDIEGLYRSLLSQLFAKIPDTQELLGEISVIRLSKTGEHSWTREELKDMLSRAIQKLGRRCLSIFVDALDECDEDQIRDMVRFFEVLGENAAASQIQLRIYFSSRHYPHITMSNKIELVIEAEDGHARDIASYIRNELRIGYNEVAEMIRIQIRQRASGVFIWVVLVVMLLNKAYDHGQIHALERKLAEMPDQLDELFKDILSRDSQNLTAMKLCIQWLLFAKRPLNVEELYFAIFSGTLPKEVVPWSHPHVTREDMHRFIISASKGLAEFTASKIQTVQFIHETVREYLLSQKGVQYLHSDPTIAPAGASHDRLKQSCANYLFYLDHLASLREDAIDIRTAYRQLWHIQPESPPLPRFPFLEYAIQHILYHAEAAETNNVSQTSFLMTFQVKSWINLTNTMDLSERYRINHFSNSSSTTLIRTADSGLVYKLDSSLLYILAERNLPGLIAAFLRAEPYTDFIGGFCGLPIFAAILHGNAEATRAILTLDLRASVSSSTPETGIFRPPSYEEIVALTDGCLEHRVWMGNSLRPIISAPWFFLERDAESIATILLRSGRYELDKKNCDLLSATPLSYAAKKGFEELAQFLLSTQQVDIESLDDNGQTPLSKAAHYGQQGVLQLLLDTKKATVNSQDSRGRTPLIHAIIEGHESIVRLFLSLPDIDVNLQDNFGRSPSSYAVNLGNSIITQMLADNQSINLD